MLCLGTLILEAVDSLTAETLLSAGRCNGNMSDSAEISRVWISQRAVVFITAATVK